VEVAEGGDAGVAAPLDTPTMTPTVAAGEGVPNVKLTVETTDVAFPAMIVGSNSHVFAVCSALA
jgi:hypothetical protein